MPPHPTPLTIIGDAAASEWLAGPRRVVGVFPTIPLTCVFLPPGPGGPLWQVNQLIVERSERGFLKVRRKEKGTDPFCAQHPAGRSGKRGLCPFPLRKILKVLQFFCDEPYVVGVW